MVDPAPRSEQLIFEVYVRELGTSAAFYQQFGFRLLRAESHFVELGWDDARIFLEEIEGAPGPEAPIVGNVRVIVPDVDRYWAQAGEIGCPVIRPIADRPYGLRDFTIAGPDGIGLRFASWLPGRTSHDS